MSAGEDLAAVCQFEARQPGTQHRLPLQEILDWPLDGCRLVFSSATLADGAIGGTVRVRKTRPAKRRKDRQRAVLRKQPQ